MNDVHSSKIDARAITVTVVAASPPDAEIVVAPDVRERIRAAMIGFRKSVRELNARR